MGSEEAGQLKVASIRYFVLTSSGTLSPWNTLRAVDDPRRFLVIWVAWIYNSRSLV